MCGRWESIAEMFVGQLSSTPQMAIPSKRKTKSQFELTASRLNHAVPMDMIQASQRGGVLIIICCSLKRVNRVYHWIQHCELDYNFLNERPPNDRDQLMNIMREKPTFLCTSC
ncbi:hypothetical protein B9Z55_029032 [Caenorhabditis nigoni]|uniref:Uncharacterized protein n=1 Tax=Caenorhabditis nigoni TaxID=1611254 RepID=A0A2G5S903_9PELO|nr:hypothetical protein B9Z55_029032 [Caenorhabditis nigoni]